MPITKQKNKNKEENLNKEEYVHIEGIRQFIQIRGKKDAKVVVLVLHGGPGGAIPYVSYYYQKPLEKDFIVVNWDQRGCGRTYYENKKTDSKSVTFEQLIKDLDKLVNYIIDEYKVEKIVILGHSWGSILGSTYIKKYPEKVLCYIGVSQIKQMKQGEIFSSKQAIELAQKNNDEQFINNLNKLITKAHESSSINDMNIKDYLKIRQMNDKYLTNPYKVSGIDMIKIGLKSPDISFRDIKWFFKSSFQINKFISIEKNLMEYCIYSFDIENKGETYDVPVYYIFGKEDHITPYSIIQEYYKKIKAPKKNIYIIEKAGHPVFLDAPKQFCETVKDILKSNQ